MVRGEGVLPGTNEVNKCCKTRARPGLPHSGYSRHAAASQRPALLLRAEVAPGPVRPNHTCLRRAPAGCLHLTHVAQGPLPILTFGDPRPACGEREVPPQLRHTPPGSTPRLPPPAARAALPARAKPPGPDPRGRARPHQSTAPSGPLAPPKAWRQGFCSLSSAPSSLRGLCFREEL